MVDFRRLLFDNEKPSAFLPDRSCSTTTEYALRIMVVLAEAGGKENH